MGQPLPHAYIFPDSAYFAMQFSELPTSQELPSTRDSVEREPIQRLTHSEKNFFFSPHQQVKANFKGTFLAEHIVQGHSPSQNTQFIDIHP